MRGTLSRLLVVNNYPTRERVERLEKCLTESGADVIPASWKELTAATFGPFDGVVLSGSPDMMSDPKVQAKFSHEEEAVLDSRIPVLGICFGHQLMANAFGSEVVKDGRRVLEMVRTDVVADDPLFGGLHSPLLLLESRHEVVKDLPGDFRLLARSSTSPIAAMKHSRRPLYGVQFHPERYTRKEADGFKVTKNFVRILA
jgi:GMP synthase (glutamine-hydrolysing)